MTVDIPVDSPNGNVFDDSIVGTDKAQNCSNLNSVGSNRLPLIILKKLEDDNQYYVQVVSPKSSNRQRKPKSYEDYEMESSPKKRARPRKLNGDLELSPTKKQKTPIKSQNKKDDTNDVDSLCSSLKTNVNIETPVKRYFNKTELLDIKLNQNAPSSRKKETRESTPLEDTPRKRGKSSNIELASPVKADENQPILSGSRPRRTPTRYRDDPIRSVKKNLNTSFRRSILTSNVNLENIRNETAYEVESSASVSTPRRSSRRKLPIKSEVSSRRAVRQSYASFYYDTCSDDDDDNTVFKKQIESAVAPSTRVLRSRSNSVSSHTSELSLKNDAESDNDNRPTKNRKESQLEKSPSDIEIEYEPLEIKTPRRRKQILRPRKDSTTSNASENSEKSPERKPARDVATTSRNKKISAPATPRSVRATPKTPKNRLKLLRDGVITPSMHSRLSAVPGDSTPLMKARSQLHVSYVPTSLPCREKEYLNVYNFVRGKLDDECGGCIYISGVPGTGKTATVTSVIDNLQNDKKVPKFSYVSVNGMRLTEPRQSYVEIWKQLTGKTVSWEQAQSLLEERFTKKKNMSSVVMLIDELDILCTKRQDVVYNLLDWPTKSREQLIVITIANTMDLPERLLMSRVTSRLGLTRLTFQAYTHKQLMEIVTKRLTGTNSFNADAVQLVARKVASVSGDARRALDICRRAAEMAEEEGEGQMVNVMHVNEALNAMITQPQVMAIRRCSRLQKLMLQAIVAEIERTGVEETTFADVFRILVSCCALDGFKMVSSVVAQRAICELSAYRLIISDQKCSNIYQKIILNVSVHDVYFALKKE